MDSNAEVMAFVGTTDPEAARRFYSEVLGLELIEDSPFALVYLTGGRTLRVQKMREPFVVFPGTVLGWKVADIAAEIAALAAKGVTFTRFDGLPQDHAGVWTSPDGNRIAWFRDPEGNNLSLTQFA